MSAPWVVVQFGGARSLAKTFVWANVSRPRLSELAPVPPQKPAPEARGACHLSETSNPASKWPRDPRMLIARRRQRRCALASIAPWPKRRAATPRSRKSEGWPPSIDKRSGQNFCDQFPSANHFGGAGNVHESRQNVESGGAPPPPRGCPKPNNCETTAFSRNRLSVTERRKGPKQITS